MTIDKSSFSSNWAYGQAKSNYHFDNDLLDKMGQYSFAAGRFEGDWSAELETVKANTSPLTWRNRKGTVSDMIDAEEADLVNAGAPADMTISDYYTGDWADIPKINSMVDVFGLTNVEKKLHVHNLGQGWNIHIDKLEDRNPSDPSRVYRFMVQLTDWEPGHFVLYGNHHHQAWKAGDITWFDWANTPHATANMNYKPRIMLMVTGVATAKTDEFINNATIKNRYSV